jgi:hypothetical protein
MEIVLLVTAIASLMKEVATPVVIVAITMKSTGDEF